MKLQDRVALVTGSSRGIGRGIARRLAEEGAKVVVNGRGAEATEGTAAEIRALGAQAIAAVGDVGYAADVSRIFHQTIQAFGRIDVLVNNAGLTRSTVHFLDMDEAHWDEMQRTNLKSVFLCCKRAAEFMRASGGSIINISSFAAERAHRSMAAYDATKGGINAFTRAIALDLAPFGIRVNSVGPGPIRFDEGDPVGPGVMAERAAPVPLGRMGRPDDVAAAVAFLASEDAAYITGHCLYVDGGMLAQLRPPQMDAQIPER